MSLVATVEKEWHVVEVTQQFPVKLKTAENGGKGEGAFVNERLNKRLR